MHRQILTVAFLFTSFPMLAVELDETSLIHALRSGRTAAQVQQIIKGLAAHGADKDKVLAKTLGKDNLTYFFLTTKEGDLKGMDLRLKGSEKERPMVLLKKLTKDWCFVTKADVKRLTVGQKTGSFFVDNECMRGFFVFQINAKGVITKLVIPRLGKKTLQGGVVIFEKK